MSQIKTTGGDQIKRPVDADLPVFAIESPSFYIDGQVTTTIEDQPIFAVEEDLELIANDGPQLGLNGEETEQKGEKQPVELISREEFIHQQAKDQEFREYAKTIGIPTFHFKFD